MEGAKSIAYVKMEVSRLKLLADELDAYAKEEAHMLIVDSGPSQIEGRTAYSVALWKPWRKPNETTH